MPELQDMPAIVIAVILAFGLCYLLYKDHIAES